MKIIIRHSLSVIVLTVIALRIYLHDPQPQYSGKKEVPGLNSPVEIFTDNSDYMLHTDVMDEA